MKKTGISRERVERASRIYNTVEDAALAMGISGTTFRRLCERFNIDTPAERRRKQAEGSPT